VSVAKKKRQVWSTRNARSLTARLVDSGVETRDSDVTSDATVTSSASSRAHKKRQMAGTETDLLNKMLYSNAKPPLPSPQSKQPIVGRDPCEAERKSNPPVGQRRAGRKQVTSPHGNAGNAALDVTSPPGNAALDEDGAGKTSSDAESTASVETFTIGSDGEQEPTQERAPISSDGEEPIQESAPIDSRCGIVSGTTSDDRWHTATDDDTSGTHHLDDHEQEESDIDEDCPLQIHEDSDAADQPCLRRSTNQTLFPKYAEHGSANLSSNRDSPVDLRDSADVDRDPEEDGELHVVGLDVSVTLDRQPGQTDRAGVSEDLADYDDANVYDKSDVAYSSQNVISDATRASSKVSSTTDSNEPVSVRGSQAAGDDMCDGAQPAAAHLLRTTESLNQVNKMQTCHINRL